MEVVVQFRSIPRDVKTSKIHIGVTTPSPKETQTNRFRISVFFFYCDTLTIIGFQETRSTSRIWISDELSPRARSPRPLVSMLGFLMIKKLLNFIW